MYGQPTTRSKNPLRSKTSSRTLAVNTATETASSSKASESLNFGAATQLTGMRTPPTSKAIPAQTPSFSLSGRTQETLRLARERHLQEVKKQARTPKPTPKVTAQNRPMLSQPSASKSRSQTISAFNPSRSRPTTPVSSFRPSTPKTPTSPRHSRQGSNRSVTASPRSTPNPVRVTSSGSSLAVRDAIKKAREEQKQKVQKTPRPRRIDYNDESSFDSIDNPFNTTPGTPPLQAQLRRAIERGRTTGTFRLSPSDKGNLNISNLELQQIPEDVYSMYDLSNKVVVVDFSSRSGGWHESVDLERFNAAGNEIAHLEDRIMGEFGAIKHFDMHSNQLSSLPDNIASLSFLRTLNLSKNSLSLNALDPIFNLATLVELYLAHNDIEGPISPSFAALENVQILDLEGNRITSIPHEISKIRRLRILLLGDNSLTDLPWQALETLDDLYQLDISTNKFSENLLPPSLDQVNIPSLSNLDVQCNFLTVLPSNLRLPSLTQFNASQNSITTSGTFFTTTSQLVHLSLAQNQLSVIPEGVVNLAHLRTLDVSNNLIEYVDPRLGLLHNLTSFQWMGNLIRQRGWGGLDTEAIKSSLRAKVDEATLTGVEEDFTGLNVDACKGECGGMLNLTGKLNETPLTQETISEHVHAAHFPVLSKIVLQKNKLVTVPIEVSLITSLTTLDLSKNYLKSNIFGERVTLDNLVHLDLSNNRIETLDDLISTLSAPQLKSLEVSFNSLTSLVPFRAHYPNLTTLYANFNQLTSLAPSDFEGLEIVQVNNNSINRLPPELGSVESLRILGVDGNTFRVPSRRIVDAGSAALLEWLRGR